VLTCFTTGSPPSLSPLSLSLFSSRPRALLRAVFEFYRVGPCDRNPATALKLFPKASSFETWAKANADKLKAAWFKE
jgi:hypothetical protein